MSFRHNGTPSSFFKCRILLPEYTDDTLPLALRLVVVVVAVYIGLLSGPEGAGTGVEAPGRGDVAAFSSLIRGWSGGWEDCEV